MADKYAEGVTGGRGTKNVRVRPGCLIRDSSAEKASEPTIVYLVQVYR